MGIFDGYSSLDARNQQMQEIYNAHMYAAAYARSGMSGIGYSIQQPKKQKQSRETLREELQDETDEWLESIN